MVRFTGARQEYKKPEDVRMSPNDNQEKEEQEEIKEEEKKSDRRPGTGPFAYDPTIFYGQTELNTEGFNTGYHSEVPFAD